MTATITFKQDIPEGVTPQQVKEWIHHELTCAPADKGNPLIDAGLTIDTPDEHNVVEYNVEQ